MTPLNDLVTDMEIENVIPARTDLQERKKSIRTNGNYDKACQTDRYTCIFFFSVIY